jgi:hypothetical protein
MRNSFDQQRPVYVDRNKREQPVHFEKIQHEKPAKLPSKLGQYTYAMDDKGIFICG